jgi:asparagine synthase (glutamine-hydrolysing)
LVRFDVPDLAGRGEDFMSGICAVWRADPQAAAGTLHRLVSGLVLADEGTSGKCDGGAGVGVSAAFETQGMHDSGRVLAACDADLDNEEELRQGLVGKMRHEARGAALIAALYEQFGPTFVERLSGTFSFVLWDRWERKMVGGIDGFGIRRLAYYRDDQAVLVATRVDALAHAGCADLEINPRAIANVLNFSSNLAPDTIFKRVARIEPGTVLIVESGRVRLQKYWDMRYGRDDAGSAEPRLCRMLENVVERSVAAQCKNESFAGLGSFLSGGTDSSTVVGMMARLDRGPVRTFSIGFQDERFNELSYARLAADHFKADHHTYVVGAADCFQALPRIVRSFDEPYGNASAIPTYFCARLAAENGVRKLLAGDGGDELFGGNQRYLTDKLFGLYQQVPGIMRRGIVEPCLQLLPSGNRLVGGARRYVRRSNLPPLERYLSYNFLSAHPLPEVFDGDFLRAVSGYSVLETPAIHYSRAPARDHLDRLLYVDVKITLADNDLPKVTCMSELAGIQTRFPFLERSVAEFSGCIPARLKVKGLQKRYLFKRAFRNLLPAEVIQKKKHGFGIPVASWLKSDPHFREYSHDILLSRRASQRGYFRRDFLEQLMRNHEMDESSYYGDTLWTILAMELWHCQVVDEPARTAV